MGVSHILVLTPFYYDMNNKSTSLIASLPITRRGGIVVYKYLSVFLYFFNNYYICGHIFVDN